MTASLLLLFLHFLTTCDWSVETWRTIVIGAGAVGQTLYVLMYACFPWWRTFMGRALFAKALTFAVLIDTAVCGRIWDWPHEEATIVALYSFVVGAIYLQDAAFLQRVWYARKRRQESAALDPQEELDHLPRPASRYKDATP